LGVAAYPCGRAASPAPAGAARRKVLRFIPVG
jgi:hypothetical protein